MIRRARPKYLENNYIDKIINLQTKKNEDFYFDRGSSAFRFLLESLQFFYDKNLTVCIQSFNCNTVLDAALNVNNIKVILSDVKLSDFSISLDFIKENAKKIDILFLLHYQGKINIEYEEIIDFCRINKIIVIEDLAHIAENSFAFKGDYGIYSYSFDKPFTCFSGGKIVFNNTQNRFLDMFEERYKKLEYENIKKTKLDLQLLKYFNNYSTTELYMQRADNQQIIKVLLNFLPMNFLYRLLKNNFFGLSIKVFFRILFKLFPKIIQENYVPQRIMDNKINLIEKQKERYLNLNNEYEQIQESIINKLNSKYNFNIDKNTNWNRLSFLDENKRIKFKNIEYGNFNWSSPLNKTYKDNKKVEFIENYDNTNFLSEHIINFPIWSEEIIKEIDDDK